VNTLLVALFDEGGILIIRSRFSYFLLSSNNRISVSSVRVVTILLPERQQI